MAAQATTGDGGMSDSGTMNDGGDAGATDSGTQQGASCGALFALCTDAQVLAIANALNQGEILEAQAVLSNTRNAQVKAYAQQMVTDHQQLLAATARIATSIQLTAEETGLSKEITSSAQMAAASFATMSASELDQSYINHEFLDHLKTSALMSRVLVASAQNSTFKTALQTAITAVETHLGAAVTVQSQIQGKCGSLQQQGSSDAGTCDDGGMMNDSGTQGGQGSSDGGTDSGQADAGTQGGQGSSDAGQDACSSGMPSCNTSH